MASLQSPGTLARRTVIADGGSTTTSSAVDEVAQNQHSVMDERYGRKGEAAVQTRRVLVVWFGVVPLLGVLIAGAFMGLESRAWDYCAATPRTTPLDRVGTPDQSASTAVLAASPASTRCRTA
jgi:hypothetical protein